MKRLSDEKGDAWISTTANGCLPRPATVPRAHSPPVCVRRRSIPRKDVDHRHGDDRISGPRRTHPRSPCPVQSSHPGYPGPGRPRTLHIFRSRGRAAMLTGLFRAPSGAVNAQGRRPCDTIEPGQTGQADDRLSRALPGSAFVRTPRDPHGMRIQRLP